MEGLLKKVNDLEKLFSKGIEENEKVSEENARELEGIKEAQKKLRAKAKDLNEREEKVKPAEDLVAYKAKADKASREANKKMKLALAEQDLADKAKGENAKILAEGKARIAKEDARIVDENAGIAKGYAQLKEAVEKSEAKMVKGVISKMSK